MAPHPRRLEARPIRFPDRHGKAGVGSKWKRLVGAHRVDAAWVARAGRRCRSGSPSGPWGNVLPPSGSAARLGGRAVDGGGGPSHWGRWSGDHAWWVSERRPSAPAVRRIIRTAGPRSATSNPASRSEPPFRDRARLPGGPVRDGNVVRPRGSRSSAALRGTARSSQRDREGPPSAGAGPGVPLRCPLTRRAPAAGRVGHEDDTRRVARHEALPPDEHREPDVGPVRPDRAAGPCSDIHRVSEPRRSGEAGIPLSCAVA